MPGPIAMAAPLFDVAADGEAAGSKTTVTPVIRAYLAAGGHIAAGGSARIVATLERVGSTPSTRIIAIDPTLDALAIDVGIALKEGDIVSFGPGAFGVGLVRVPITPGGSAVKVLPGFAGGRNFGVLVLGAGLIRLGAAFDASGAGSAIDPVRDTITFGSPHLFNDGDVVKLANPRIGGFDPATGVDDATDVITLTAFADLETGDPVIYRHEAGGSGVVGLTNGATYYLIVDLSDRRKVRLAASAAAAAAGTALPIAPASVGGGLDGLDGIVEGLSAGTPYKVVVIDAWTIKLATGTEAPAKSFTGGNVLNDTITVAGGHGFVDGQAVTYRGPGLGRVFGREAVDILLGVGGAPFPATVGGITTTLELPTADNIYLPNHGFSTGTTVSTRRRPAVRPSAG